MNLMHRIKNAFEAFNGRRFTRNDAAYIAKRMMKSMRVSDLRNFYDSSDRTIRTTQPNTQKDPYTLQVDQLPKTRAVSQRLYRNAGDYRSTINTTVDSVIGTGLRPTPQVMTQDGNLETSVNAQLARLWELYEKPRNWDSRNKVSFVGEGQRLALKTRLLDGSYFLRALPNNKSVLGVVWDSFSIENLDTSYDTYYSADSVALPTSVTINGIKLDRYGAPLGYYLKQFPGRLVSSNQVIHSWEVSHPSYVIGEPIGIAVLNQIWDRKELIENYRLKMEAIARVLYNIAESSNYPNPLDEDSDGFFGIESLTGNRVKETPESPKMPDNVNETLVPLLGQLETENAAGMGISRTSALKDLRGTTFAGATYAGVMDWSHYKPLRKDFIDDFCNPFYRMFVFNAVMSGKVFGIDRTAFIRRPEHYTAVAWSGDERLSVDKKKDADASRVQKETGEKLLGDRLQEAGKTLQDHIRKAESEYQAVIEAENNSPGIAAMLGYPELSTKKGETDEV